MDGILPRRFLAAVAVFAGAQAGSASADDLFILPGLLAIPSVATDLRLSQVQMGNAQIAIREARLGKKENLAKLLGSLQPTQRTVLEQMSVQRAGFRALLDPRIGRRAEIGKAQQDRLGQVLKYYDPALPDGILSGTRARSGGTSAAESANKVIAAVTTRIKYRDRLAGEVRRVIGDRAFAKFLAIRGPLRPTGCLRITIYELLQQAHYQEELRLTAAQARAVVDKLRGRTAASSAPPAPVQVQVLAERALELLTAAQRVRIRELACQKLGPAAISAREVAIPLKLTHEQYLTALDVTALSQAEAILEFDALPKTPAGLMPPPGQYERVQKAKEAREKRFQDGILAILTPSQRKQWTQMLGQPMKTKPLPAGL